MTEAFDIAFKDLPAEIPVFPLPRVILLPRVQLPLNIFEPRYLAMVDAAMRSHRMIGMIQPQSDAAGADLCAIGGAGRIVSFTETDDGRYLITLKGVCRFRLSGGVEKAAGGYLHTRPDWAPFADDFNPDTVTDICRDAMINRLHAYFKQMEMSCDQWEQIRQIGCERLVSTLSVVCPFESEEKQALLEAPTLAERARLLQGLLERAVRQSCCGDSPETCH
jgi:Lon protease-like protein